MAKMYYTYKTLLGGPPDTNRRRVCEAEIDKNGKPVYSSEKTVCVINPNMDVWTVDHMRWEEAIIDGLKRRAESK